MSKTILKFKTHILRYSVSGLSTLRRERVADCKLLPRNLLQVRILYEAAGNISRTSISCHLAKFTDEGMCWKSPPKACDMCPSLLGQLQLSTSGSNPVIVFRSDASICACDHFAPTCYPWSGWRGKHERQSCNCDRASICHLPRCETWLAFIAQLQRVGRWLPSMAVP